MSALATNSDKPHPIGGRRGAWPGFKTRAWPQCRWAAARPGWASPSDTSAAGVEGAGGTCRGAGGRRRGLAGLVQATQVPPVWRAPEGRAAVPVGGGRAWPDNESTRRAKLAARTTRGRAAAHRHTQRPGPSRQATRRPEIWRGNEHRRKSGDATSPRRTEKPQNSS